jgi:hypothetical protein
MFGRIGPDVKNEGRGVVGCFGIENLKTPLLKLGGVPASLSEQAE